VLVIIALFSLFSFFFCARAFLRLVQLQQGVVAVLALVGRRCSLVCCSHMCLVRMSLPQRGTGAPKKSGQKVVVPKPKAPTKEGAPPKRRGRPRKQKEEDAEEVAAEDEDEEVVEEDGVDEEAEARPSKRQEVIRHVREAGRKQDDDEDDEGDGMGLGLPLASAEKLFERFAHLMDQKLEKHLEKTSELITNVVPGEVKKALENRSLEENDVTASSAGMKPHVPPRPLPIVLQSSAGVNFVVNVAQLLGACQPPNAPKLKSAHFVEWLVLSYKEKFRTLPPTIKNACMNGNQELNDELISAMFATACGCFKSPKVGAAAVKLQG
jgi:hypothetical protein